MQAQTSLNSLASECKESRVANHNAEKGWVAKAFRSFSCFLLLTLLYLTEEKKIIHHVVFFKIDTLDCKNVDTQQAFIMNDETQQRAIQTFPEENVLSWEKIFHE